MIWPDNLLLEGAAVLVAGVGIGFWLLRWRERNFRQALALKEQTVLEEARREAENLTREARLAANEEILKLRDQTEKSFSARRQELAGLEHRLSERENLINHQLAGLVEQEKSLRAKHQGLEARQSDLEATQQQLQQLIKLRKEQLQRIAHLSENDARAALLKEVEEENQRS